MGGIRVALGDIDDERCKYNRKDCVPVVDADQFPTLPTHKVSLDHSMKNRL